MAHSRVSKRKTTAEFKGNGTHAEHPKRLPEPLVAPSNLLQYLIALEVPLEERPVHLLLQEVVHGREGPVGGKVEGVVRSVLRIRSRSEEESRRERVRVHEGKGAKTKTVTKKKRKGTKNVTRSTRRT